jgi:hypothetical protein
MWTTMATVRYQRLRRLRQSPGYRSRRMTTAARRRKILTI